MPAALLLSLFVPRSRSKFISFLTNVQLCESGLEYHVSHVEFKCELDQTMTTTPRRQGAEQRLTGPSAVLATMHRADPS